MENGDKVKLKSDAYKDSGLVKGDVGEVTGTHLGKSHVEVLFTHLDRPTKFNLPVTDLEAADAPKVAAETASK